MLLKRIVLTLMGTGSAFAPVERLLATDYFLTIGGGYQADANQASLEANVLFFQDVLKEQHQGQRHQAIFFADGNDPQPDLQVLSPSSRKAAGDAATTDLVPTAEATPVTELLGGLMGFRDNEKLEYRNHRIANVSGANVPQSIHASLQHMVGLMTSGDRLIVYVTAHGSQAKGRNPYNTSISCWDEQSITAREFESWLDEVPASVPVVLVMAQCYCGGFAHTIFDQVDRRTGLADQVRVGFFAQQHDLAAAGCRPDIENDAEYSSFFWGAFVGRSRTGKEMTSADFNSDGRISFAEAHAHAMLTSQTIDIPLRSSEALLRVYSEIGGYDHRRDRDVADDDAADDDAADDDGDEVAERAVASDSPRDASSDVNSIDSMVGSLAEITSQATPELQQTVAGLAAQLDIQLTAAVPVVFIRFDEQRDVGRKLQRESGRGRRRGGSGRRELRQEIGDQWPELVQQDWSSAELLRVEGQAELMAKIKQLPSYSRYNENRLSRQALAEAREKAELREVKFQRLINTLEAIVLAKNLPRLASPEVVQRYEEMLAIEQSTLQPVR